MGMQKRGQLMAKETMLTPLEKRVAKALLAGNWRNQDIQALINTGRKATVNSGRITGVKKNSKQELATDEEVEFFKRHRLAYDNRTGLNPYDDEKLIRAREAMILAVHIFNSPALKFKTEVFCMLANVAWTYLMHEYYTRKTNVAILKPDGYSLALSEIIERQDCPLNENVRKNLRALKILRDSVEHHLLGKADQKWLGIFQACCLNFEKALCNLFDSRLTLSSELAFALQFARIKLDQAADLSRYDLPDNISAIDALLIEGMTPEQLNSIEYQFQVVYTLTAAPKSKAHIQFLNPESAEGQKIQNVLAKKIIADDHYPYKPGKVIELVKRRTGKAFTNNDHTRCWKLYKVRSKPHSSQPENTDKQFCIYHKAHGDYTYSDEWVQKLVAAMQEPLEMAKIRAVKLA